MSVPSLITIFSTSFCWRVLRSATLKFSDLFLFIIALNRSYVLRSDLLILRVQFHKLMESKRICRDVVPASRSFYKFVESKRICGDVAPASRSVFGFK
ncbi:hypothetical protein ACOSP7_010915 [Xanthoceras sorbifolium]